MIIYTSSQGEIPERAKKVNGWEKEEDFEKNRKNFQKGIDKRESMWYTLWAVLERVVAIGPWKLNNEIRKGTRDFDGRNHQKSFKKYFSNSNTEAKKAKY